VDSVWSEEILVPSANVLGYRLIFEAETWLRRICWTALLVAEGPAWVESLDEQFRKRLEAQSSQNSSRWYLGVDAEEELLWSTSHGQLATLLRRQAIKDEIYRLCGYHGELLAKRLESVSLVRNTLAHGRAISEESIRILKADLSVIRGAVDRFKNETLYAQIEIVSIGDGLPDDLYEFMFAFKNLDRGIRGQQLFVGVTDDLVSLVRLPVDPWGWPDGRKLRDHLGEVAHLIVCILANKSGDEFQILMPRRLPLNDKMQVLTRFMMPELLANSMTDTPFEKQPATSSCWPRLWFYENRRPDQELLSD